MSDFIFTESDFETLCRNIFDLAWSAIQSETSIELDDAQRSMKVDVDSFLEYILPMTNLIINASGPEQLSMSIFRKAIAELSFQVVPSLNLLIEIPINTQIGICEQALELVSSTDIFGLSEKNIY